MSKTHAIALKPNIGKLVQVRPRNVKRGKTMTYKPVKGVAIATLYSTSFTPSYNVYNIGSSWSGKN
ncbi:hypothetical protein [Crinalium epipsammum]|uniref:hypothetical protein n=1 Tax=Crinalium epipsammum TaxID=241425 RepID=UPI0002E3A4A5|nr:hypothetical protein [Crinalium epipsammum]